MIYLYQYIVDIENIGYISFLNLILHLKSWVNIFVRFIDFSISYLLDC